MPHPSSARQPTSQKVRDVIIPASPHRMKAHSPSAPFFRAESCNDDSEVSEEEDTHELGDSSSDVGEDRDSLEEHLDAPRISQWVDEDELRAFASDGSGSEDEVGSHDLHADDSSSTHMDSLRNDLSSLPLGALRKAQRALGEGDAPDGSGDSDSHIDSDSPARRDVQEDEKIKESPKKSSKLKSLPLKRSNKHAPVEVTSKRPVSNKRTVVDVKAVKPRDPRFLAVSGQFSAQKFHSQYGFLKDLHSDELNTLKDSLKRVRKLMQSSPRHLRSLHAAETSRLELAVKRAESAVNKDKKERVELEATAKAAKEEREKRKHGKAAWWMKRSEKKALLTRARYDALTASGGTAAVRKAIAKKQKKLGQSEKKSRPFAWGQGWMRGGNPMKRKSISERSGPGTPTEAKKRRRIENP